MKTEKLLDIIENIIYIHKLKEQNKHNGVSVGDRVIVWDGSYNVDINTGKHRHGIDPLFENSFVVVCDDYKEEVIDCFGDVEILDLLLWNEEYKVLIATQSGLVKVA